MISAVRSFGVLLVCCVVFSTTLAAQDDVIARARAAAAAGNRGEALTLLQARLTSTPNDVDARLVYGLILSWDGKYDEARTQLSQVLAEAPNYTDARVALMNVEWWSGRTEQARDLNRIILAQDPGNTQARLVKQRLDARIRPWSFGAAATVDSFSDHRDGWTEFALSAGRTTPVGSLIVRGNRAERFGLHDQQLDIEFYPTFRAGSYAFIGVGVGSDQTLYPEHRVSFDLYQSIGHGFEVSGGFRRLAFAERTSIYLATLTKYTGNWMLTGKAFVVPDDLVGNSWSYHAVARRYFGNSGTSFYGAGYSHGFSREEPRGQGDLIRVDADTFRGQLDLDLSNRFLLSFSASASRQERALLSALWQTTLAGGVTLRY